MNNIEKFDLWLMQNCMNSANMLRDIRNIVIGGLNRNMRYTDTNPLLVRIQSKNFDKKPTETSVEMISNNNFNFKVQYSKRIPETPFYVNYLTDSQFSLKIIDFYSWIPEIIIYRLMIFNKLDNSSKEYKNIKFKIDKINHNKNETDNIFLFSSNNLEMNGNSLFCKPNNDDEIFSFGFAFTFKKCTTQNVQFSVLSKILKSLTEKCKTDHIKKFFITKNNSAEKELDQLWFKQKYIHPDWQIESDLLKNQIEYFPKNLFIYDFYEFFNRAEELDKIRRAITEESDLNTGSPYYDIVLNYILKADLNISDDYKNGINKDKQGYQPNNLNSLPSIKKLLYYNYGTINQSEIIRDLQLWWDVYSLPLFEKKFQTKYFQNPNELFTIFFLAVHYNMVWANILFDKIKKISNIGDTNTANHFLFLLSFLYKRISKKMTSNKSLEIIPGYKWDNNYKSVKSINDNLFVEYSKFSKKMYTSISKDSIKFLRLDKLCRISFNNKQKTIQIVPAFYASDINMVAANKLKLNINQFNLIVSLLWRSGELVVFNTRIKWLLKKNRFQFTIHSDIEQKIELNDRPYFLAKKEKMVVYQEVKYHPVEMCFNVFNWEGRSFHSSIDHKSKKMIVSGYAITNYGVFTQNILCETHSVHKHKLENNDDLQFKYEIPIKSKISEISFFTKRARQSSKLEYYNNYFIDKLANIDVNYGEDSLIILFDSDFRKDLTLVNSYFQNLIGHNPEFIEYKNELNIKNILSLFIYFKKTTDLMQGCKLDKHEKKLLTINSPTIRRSVQLFSNFIETKLIEFPIPKS